MRGNPLPLTGTQLYVGDTAPDFRLHQRAPDGLKDVTLEDYAGHTLILSVIFSIETPVCQSQTRRFNEAVIELPGDVDVLCVSMDLPYAQNRWSNENSAHHVRFGSDHRTGDFGRAYGVLIEPLRLLSRAVFVIGPTGQIKHVQYADEITREPDYESALTAAREPSD
jgi:thiol peroxidase